MSRPSFFTGSTVIAVLLTSAGLAWGQQGSETYTFHSRRAPGSIDAVKTTLEVRGDLVVTEEGKLKRLKTGVLANVDYQERCLTESAQGGGPLRAVRSYGAASAEIQIEQTSFKPTLRGEHRLIGVKIDGKSATLFSPSGPLTREELDLIDLQGNSLLVDRLLPGKPVAIGDQWDLAEELVTVLLRLDELSKSKVTAHLVSVQNGAAIVELSGNVEGAINGVSTEIELKGKYRFNVPAGRIDWVAFLIRENRSIGHVGTGLDVVARLQTTITPAGDAKRLGDAALRGLTLEPTPELTQLIHRSGDKLWEFTYDRRWFITAETKDHVVLRFVDRGELMAQCSIAGLGAVPMEKLVSLASFQQDIQRALGKNFGQFVKATQQVNAANYRVYRVAAEGQVEGLPIQWFYHLVASRQGHQVSFAFTIEENLVEQFGQADEPLVQSLRFSEPDVALRVKPTPNASQLRVLAR